MNLYVNRATLTQSVRLKVQDQASEQRKNNIKGFVSHHNDNAVFFSFIFQSFAASVVSVRSRQSIE